jgi:hypothetical protein
MIGIIGAIIALIGLALPWWTYVQTPSYSYSIYLYQTTAHIGGASVIGPMNLWYGWVAFVLLVLGALFGIAGSLIQARAILVIGGILPLLSVIIFAAGLQNQLSSTSGGSGIGLFSTGSFFVYSYTTYLSFGFWFALIGAIVMLAALLKKPKAAPQTVIPPAPPEPEKAGTAPS